MKFKLLVLSAVLSLAMASTAVAIDEGQTRPRLNSEGAFGGQTTYLIPLTQGAGNIKGISCNFVSSSAKVKINFTIDGGSVQQITIHADHYPIIDSRNRSPFIPMNVRFESSILVQMDRTGSTGSGESFCVASWGLD